MDEGKLKKRIERIIPEMHKLYGTSPLKLNFEIKLLKIIDDAKKDFELSEDELFELKEYGFEDNNKLTEGAQQLKVEILQRTVKKLMDAKKKWFGDSS